MAEDKIEDLEVKILEMSTDTVKLLGEKADEYDLSMRVIAGRLGVSHTQVHRWLSGASALDIEQQRLVLSFLADVERIHSDWKRVATEWPSMQDNLEEETKETLFNKKVRQILDDEKTMVSAKAKELALFTLRKR